MGDDLVVLVLIIIFVISVYNSAKKDNYGRGKKWE